MIVNSRDFLEEIITLLYGQDIDTKYIQEKLDNMRKINSIIGANEEPEQCLMFTYDTKEPFGTQDFKQEYENLFRTLKIDKASTMDIKFKNLKYDSGLMRLPRFEFIKTINQNLKLTANGVIYPSKELLNEALNGNINPVDSHSASIHRYQIKDIEKILDAA